MAYASSSSSTLIRGDASSVSKGGSILVVLGVLDGRNFPKRPKHELAVEATFDSESLETDHRTHSELPGLVRFFVMSYLQAPSISCMCKFKFSIAC